MEAAMVKPLLAPFRKFTNCVTETLQDIWRSESLRSKFIDQNPVVLRVNQAKQERDRKLRETKNAERAAMRAHFRKKYQLPTNTEDSRRARAAVGKVIVPCHLTNTVQPKTPEEESSGLLSVFQNLRFSTDLHSAPSTRGRTARSRV